MVRKLVQKPGLEARIESLDRYTPPFSIRAIEALHALSRD